jgi:branched-chain amino acid transport system ATP-binding protein
MIASHRTRRLDLSQQTAVVQVRAAVDNQRMARGLGINVEQHADVALSLTDHALVLERGAIVHRAPSSELMRDAAVPERYIGLRVSPEA